MKNRVYFITHTAIFIALIIAVQFVTKGLSQYVTGALVNLILITCVMTLGMGPGVVTAALSPVFAFLVGIGPAFIQIVPAIMVGNIILVILIRLIWRNAAYNKNDFVKPIAAVVLAACVKALTLWLLIVKLLLPIVPGIKEAQIGVISAAFSWPQLVTALIGGAVAIALVPAVSKALASVRREGR